MENKVRDVIALFESTPSDGGLIVDSDTVLYTILEDAAHNFDEHGLSIEILKTWLSSTDRAAIELVFYGLTGVKFEEYIDWCIQDTTR